MKNEVIKKEIHYHSITINNQDVIDMIYVKCGVAIPQNTSILQYGELIITWKIEKEIK